MQVYQSQTESRVAEIIEQELLAMGYELVRIRVMGGSRSKTLQIMIDRLDGVNINVSDCEKASRHISILMDVNDPIELKYILELSSPGLNRPLTRHKDLVAHSGQNVKLSLKVPLEGQKNFVGTLSQVTDSQVTLVEHKPEKKFVIDIENIQDAQLIVLETKSQKKVLNKKNNNTKKRKS